MAPPRATWKGFLKIAEVVCPVALYAAASSSERITLSTVNRATGNRVQRQFVDAVDGKPVDKEDQVKGYELGKDDYIILEPEEIAAAVPESDKTLKVSAFIDESEIDDVYFDRPYFVGPADRSASEAYALIREGLRASKTAAIAEAVIFRRVRSLLIRPYEQGLAATTLNFDYEVRAAAEAFADVPTLRIKGEMLELAEHIIKTKRGRFDPEVVHDRYEAALAELVKAKIEGREIVRPKPPKPVTADALLDALRESAGLTTKAPAKREKASAGEAKAKAPPRKRAG